MDMVRLRHPDLANFIEVPAESAGQHAMAGWVPAEGEPVPTCPTCHQVWPAYAESPPEQQSKTDEAPAESGASASETAPRRRRSTGKENE
jgi:hypothetical protein